MMMHNKLCLCLLPDQDSSASVKSLSREQSVEVIHLDILRTFPTLGFFQEVNSRPLQSGYTILVYSRAAPFIKHFMMFWELMPATDLMSAM